MGAKRRRVLAGCTQFHDELSKGTMSVIQVAPLAKTLGVDGVEYRDVYWRNRQEELPAIQKQLAELELLGTYATNATLLNLDGAGLSRLLADIDDTCSLGSPLLRVWLGPTPKSSEERKSAYRSAEVALERAKAQGLVIALENMSAPPGNSVRDILPAAARFGPLGLMLNVDVGNYAMNGQDPLEAIRLCAGQIVYMHLKDVTGIPDKPAFAYLGAGQMDFAAILEESDLTGMDFALAFEFLGEGDSEECIRRSLSHLQAIWG